MSWIQGGLLSLSWSTDRLGTCLELFKTFDYLPGPVGPINKFSVSIHFRQEFKHFDWLKMFIRNKRANPNAEISSLSKFRLNLLKNWAQNLHLKWLEQTLSEFTTSDLPVQNHKLPQNSDRETEKPQLFYWQLNRLTKSGSTRLELLKTWSTVSKKFLQLFNHFLSLELESIPPDGIFLTSFD